MRERLGLVDEKIEDNKKVAVEGDKPVGEAPAAPEGQGAGEGSAAKKGSSFQFGFSINSEVHEPLPLPPVNSSVSGLWAMPKPFGKTGCNRLVSSRESLHPPGASFPHVHASSSAAI